MRSKLTASIASELSGLCSYLILIACLSTNIFSIFISLERSGNLSASYNNMLINLAISNALASCTVYVIFYVLPAYDFWKKKINAAAWSVCLRYSSSSLIEEKSPWCPVFPKQRSIYMQTNTLNYDILYELCNLVSFLPIL